MVTKLNLYKGDTKVKSVDKAKEGKTKITITELTSNTEYSKGEYSVTYSNENGESNRVEVPGFKTLNVPLTGLNADPDNIDLELSETSKINLIFEPTNASNKRVAYSVPEPSKEYISVDSNGVVTPKKLGQASVLVVSDEGEFELYVNINVIPEQIEPPTNIQVEPEVNTATITKD